MLLLIFYLQGIRAAQPWCWWKRPCSSLSQSFWDYRRESKADWSDMVRKYSLWLQSTESWNWRNWKVITAVLLLFEKIFGLFCLWPGTIILESNDLISIRYVNFHIHLSIGKLKVLWLYHGGITEWKAKMKKQKNIY